MDNQFDGYKLFEYREDELHIQAEAPSGWVHEKHPLESQKGQWLSWQGPANTRQPGYCALDVYVVEKSAEEQHASLQVFSEDVLNQESLGKVEVLGAPIRKNSPAKSMETKIRLERTAHTTQGIRSLVTLKQWCNLETKQHFLMILYEASEIDFSLHIEVYDRFVDSLRIVNDA